VSDRFADPLTHAPLDRDGALLRNDAGVWPILGGVPVLVPEPAAWVAARRRALLGALAEAGRCEPADVALSRAFAETARGVAPAHEPDDFLPAEEGPVAVLHPAMAELLRLRPTLPELLAARCGAQVLEVGCGAGPLTARLADPVVLDRSLPALLRATAHGGLPVVGEATALPFRDRSFRTVVAANVVDLLEDPAAFVGEASRVLRKGGRLVLSTPDPALGGGEDGALDDLVTELGFDLEEVADGVPWVRAHGPRHAQLYVCRVLVARRR
jgi:SAM-dependent methyltransferase